MDKRTAGLFLTSALAAAHTPADITPNRAFDISGYGTLALTRDSQEDTAFVRELTQRPEGTRGNNPSPQTDPWLTDSRLGLQALLRLNTQAELVAQLSIRDQEKAGLDNALEWAYLGLHPAPDLDLRLGRDSPCLRAG